MLVNEINLRLADTENDLWKSLIILLLYKTVSNCFIDAVNKWLNDDLDTDLEYVIHWWLVYAHQWTMIYTYI